MTSEGDCESGPRRPLLSQLFQYPNPAHSLAEPENSTIASARSTGGPSASFHRYNHPMTRIGPAGAVPPPLSSSTDGGSAQPRGHPAWPGFSGRTLGFAPGGLDVPPLSDPSSPPRVFPYSGSAALARHSRYRW